MFIQPEQSHYHLTAFSTKTEKETQTENEISAFPDPGEGLGGMFSAEFLCRAGVLVAPGFVGPDVKPCQLFLHTECPGSVGAA